MTTPMYRQIADDLRAAIERGEYRPGDLIPREQDLMARYGVGRGTVRQAVGELQTAGLLVPIRRRGTVVRALPGRRRLRRGHLVSRDPARGYIFPAAAHPQEPWTNHGKPYRQTMPIPDEVAERLGVPAGSEVLRRRRVTSPAGEPPFQLVDTWIHPQGVADAPQVAEASTGPGGYLDRLEETGHGPVSWVETTRARLPDVEEARLLGIPAAMPVIELVRVGTSARTDAPIEVTVCVIPSDRVELETELTRARSARWPVTPVAPQDPSG